MDKESAFSCADSVKSATTQPCTREWFESKLNSEKVKGLVKEIRNTPDKNARSKLKIQLPIIIPQAVIADGKRRKGENVERLSGYVMTDLDHVSSDRKELERIYNEQIKPRIDELGIVMVFISPSGDGLKIMSKINLNTNNTHD
ncbi:MAG: hypothetical protein IKR18_00470 [Bacteroidaceae bacterium]|nr:hypothetical protein [Bacteroidaceae bacterium]